MDIGSRCVRFQAEIFAKNEAKRKIVFSRLHLYDG